MSKLAMFALGTALSPIAAVYGLGSFVAARQPESPPLPLSANAGLVLGIGALLVFAACVWGLQHAFAEKLRHRREETD